jgi:hypothetical protein
MATSRSRGESSLTTLVADLDRPFADLLETRDHAQRRRLAAAARPDEHDEVAVFDVEVRRP